MARLVGQLFGLSSHIVLTYITCANHFSELEECCSCITVLLCKRPQHQEDKFSDISNCEYYLLLQVVGNRTMLKPVLNNAIVKSVSESLMSSVNDAYKAAERSSGAEWRSLSTTERFLRIFREVNLVSHF